MSLLLWRWWRDLRSVGGFNVFLFFYKKGKRQLLLFWCHFAKVFFNFSFFFFTELSQAQRTLSKSLKEFNFECIGSTQTDDEQVIVASLKQFSELISQIEDERDNMLDRAQDTIVIPLENFRKQHINGVKEVKKKFEKKTAKFCQAQERFLQMSSKKPDNTIQEVSFYLFIFFLICNFIVYKQQLDLRCSDRLYDKHFMIRSSITYLC